MGMQGSGTQTPSVLMDVLHVGVVIDCNYKQLLSPKHNHFYVLQGPTIVSLHVFSVAVSGYGGLVEWYKLCTKLFYTQKTMLLLV